MTEVGAPPKDNESGADIMDEMDNTNFQRQLALLRQGMDKGQNTTKASKLAFWVRMMEVETTHG